MTKAPGLSATDDLKRATGFIVHFPATVLGVLRNPLVGNGYALIASAALSSVLGLAFWATATRLYAPEAVGLGAAMISTMMTIGSISQLNMGNALNRFLATAGRSGGGMIIAAYAIAGTVAFILAVALSPVIGGLVAPLDFHASDMRLTAAFAIATAAWAIFALQDSALAGLRQSIYVPAENLAYSLSKLALLPVFAGSAYAFGGVFAAWVAPVLVLVVLVNLLIYLKLLPATGRRSDAFRPDPRQLFHLMGWDYIGTLATMLAMAIAPLVVASVSGTAANAVFYLAWTIAYSLYLVGRSMSVSLVAESATDPARLKALTADALLYTFLPLAIAGALLIAGAPLLMSLFGPWYATEGPLVLRLLVLSCLPWSVVTIYIAKQRALLRSRPIAAVQVATLLIVTSVGAALVGTLGPTGMAIAWLLAHSVVASAIVAFGLLSAGREGLLDWLLTFGSSAGRLRHSLRFWSRGPAPDLPEEVRAFVEATPLPGSRPVRVVQAQTSVTDCTTLALGQIVDGHTHVSAYLKTAVSHPGRAALRRGADALETLDRDSRFARASFCFPHVLGRLETRETTMLLESAVPGEDGRSLFARIDRRSEALTAGLRAAAELHALTRRPAVIDDDWLARWVEHPLAAIAGTDPAGILPASRATALARMRATLRRHFSGRETIVGIGHGDLAPGNILFAPAGDCRVSGLLDWDNLSTDAPTGFDACGLLMAVRASSRGAEMGQIVRDFLEDTAWQADEAAAISAAGMDAILSDRIENHPALRAMITLTWLNHTAANIRKSERYARGRFWIAANVDWVLRASDPTSSGGRS